MWKTVNAHQPMEGNTVVEAAPEDELALEELVRSGGIETYFAPSSMY